MSCALFQMFIIAFFMTDDNKTFQKATLNMHYPQDISWTIRNIVASSTGAIVILAVIFFIDKIEKLKMKIGAPFP